MKGNPPTMLKFIAKVVVATVVVKVTLDVLEHTNATKRARAALKGAVAKAQEIQRNRRTAPEPPSSATRSYDPVRDGSPF